MPETATTLFDILGVVIGFSSVMLLLSLVVTAMVQFTQHLFNLRSQNLRRGLTSLLEEVVTSSDDDARGLADGILNAGCFTPQGRSRLMTYLPRHLLSPSRSWIDSDELVDDLQRLGRPVAGSEQLRLVKLFKRMEGYSRNRFRMHVRFLSVIWAVLIAFYFQVNTFELLNDLTTNPDLRAQTAIAAERILHGIETTTGESSSFENVSGEALRRLQERHPDLAPQIEEAAGIGTDRDDIVGELDEVFADLPAQRLEIVREYEKILEGLHSDQADAALQRARDLTRELAMFNISPWKHGWSFYSRPDRWVGVLITAILLTLGAPFWFETLRNVVKLKDAMQPDTPKDPQEKNDPSNATWIGRL